MESLTALREPLFSKPAQIDQMLVMKPNRMYFYNIPASPTQPMETHTKSVAQEVAELLAKGEELIAQAETLLVEENVKKYPLDK